MIGLKGFIFFSVSLPYFDCGRTLLLIWPQEVIVLKSPLFLLHSLPFLFRGGRREGFFLKLKLPNRLCDTGYPVFQPFWFLQI